MKHSSYRCRCTILDFYLAIFPLLKKLFEFFHRLGTGDAQTHFCQGEGPRRAQKEWFGKELEFALELEDGKRITTEVFKVAGERHADDIVLWNAHCLYALVTALFNQKKNDQMHVWGLRLESRTFTVME